MLNEQIPKDVYKGYFNEFDPQNCDPKNWAKIAKEAEMKYDDFPTPGRPFTGDFDRYLTYLHGQVKEICTNYGHLDILWFDYSYGEMTGEKWRATTNQT